MTVKVCGIGYNGEIVKRGILGWEKGANFVFQETANGECQSTQMGGGNTV